MGSQLPAATTAPVSYSCPENRRHLVLVVAILATAMGLIDGSIVTVAIPKIRTSLDASFGEVQWVHNGYMLFLSSLMLVGGTLGDRYGIRNTFAIGVVAFSAASVLCAFASTPESLIAFRAVQGAGAAIMVPGSLALISRNYPRENRGKAIGIWISASAITTALGPTIGSVLLSFGDAEVWRWIFLINLPFGLLVVAILYWVPKDPAGSSGKLDTVGAIMLTLTMGALALGLTLYGEHQESWLPLTLLCGGLVGGVATYWWEKRVRNPMLPLTLFQSRVFSGATLQTFLVWSGLGIILFYLPMVLIVGWNLPEYYAAGVFLPLSVMIGSISSTVGRLNDRYGARFMLISGPLIVALSQFMMVWAIIEHNYWWGLIPATTVMGIGMGMVAPTVSTVVMMATGEKHSGAASGINNMTARMSNLFAVAALGVVASRMYDQSIRESGLHQDVRHLMLEAGFGERLSGALYQVATVKLQAQIMDEAMIVFCIVTAMLGIVGSLVGWFSSPKKAETEPSQSPL